MQAGYHPDVFGWCWDIFWFGGCRGLLDRLSDDDLRLFRQESRLEIEYFASDRGIWLNVEALTSMARNPSHAWTTSPSGDAAEA
jgi:hypothetical protein